MEWIKTSVELPEEGKYVLTRHNRTTWIDSSDQKNVNCVVAKLVKGISLEERKKLSDSDKRKKIYTQSDQHSNNELPYNWRTFGNINFFGQEIIEWKNI